VTRRAWLWPAGLAALVLGVYARTAAFDFVAFDDNRYVTENPHVRGGLSWEGLRWAFGSRDDNYWHPLAFVSHMADVSLAGATPGWPHAENVLLHLANVLLLFFLLKGLTGEEAPAAFVAAVFAVHPVQNETVAWISERKSLLAALFCLLSLRAYAGRRRFQTAAFYALSLMAKPSSVGFPLALLALDYWPLRRHEPWRKLIAEKAPLFALAAAASVVARLTAVHVSALSWTMRLSNVVMSQFAYLRTVVWPAGLEVFYRYPAEPAPLVAVAGGALVLGLAALLAWRERRHRPAVFAGALWYAVFLAPSSGLVPIGAHARADRFLYMPLVGFAVALAYGWPAGYLRRARPLLAGAAVVALVVVASVRLDDWKDSVSLFSRALAVDDGSALGHMQMGFSLFQAGRADEAIPHYRRAVALQPNYAEAHNYLAIALATRGELPEAAEEFKTALAYDPGTPFAAQNLASVTAAAKRGKK
jgi:tetratricopeptide (TPR) repeat protein